MTEEPEEGRKIGYARVSTVDQNVAMQVEALLRYGVPEESIYHESASGVKKDRPQLAQALRATARGDTLVVWKLDRIARSFSHLHELAEDLKKRGVAFRSITEGFETETPAGQLLFNMLGSLAQFERDLIVERTRAGIAAAKARGVKFGSKQRVSDAAIAKAWKDVHEGGRTRKEIAKEVKLTVQHLKRRFDLYEKDQAMPVLKKKAVKKRSKRRSKKR